MPKNFNKPMLIGVVSQQFGISPKTIRWYESKGLLHPTERSESGYRYYSPQNVERIAFIRRALQLGFSVKEIQQILQIRQSGSVPCESVLKLLDEHIGELEERIETLEVLKMDLKKLRTTWRKKRGEGGLEEGIVCPLIESDIN